MGKLMITYDPYDPKHSPNYFALQDQSFRRICEEQSIAAMTHTTRISRMDSELTTSPTERTVFSRILDSLDVYKTYAPQVQEDYAEIIAAANALLKAAGAK